MSDDGGRRFRIAKAEREEDCRVITPLDALEDAAEKVRSGEIEPTKLLILFQQPQDREKPDGLFVQNYFAANVTLEEHCAMLRIQERLLLDYWLGE